MRILKVGEKQYIIKFSINSLIKMEQDTGKPFTELFGDENDISLGSLRTIVYYGLLEKQHDMSQEKAGAIMGAFVEEGKSIMELTESFVSELASALGVKSEETVDSPNE